MEISRFRYIVDWFELLKIVQNDHNIINCLSKKDQFDDEDELNSHKREQKYKQLLRDPKCFAIIKIATICGSKKWRS